MNCPAGIFIKVVKHLPIHVPFFVSAKWYHGPTTSKSTKP